MGGSKEHEHGFCEIEQKKKKTVPTTRPLPFPRLERNARGHTHTRSVLLRPCMRASCTLPQGLVRRYAQDRRLALLLHNPPERLRACL